MQTQPGCLQHLFCLELHARLLYCQAKLLVMLAKLKREVDSNLWLAPCRRGLGTCPDQNGIARHAQPRVALFARYVTIHSGFTQAPLVPRAVLMLKILCYTFLDHAVRHKKGKP